MSLPSGYTRLEYIESTGTQYIDTGFKPTGNSKLEVTFQTTKTMGVVIGCDSGWLSNGFMVALNVSSFNTGSNFYSLKDSKKHTVAMESGALTVDGNNVGSAGSGSFTGNATVCLFTNNRSGTKDTPTAQKQWGAKLWENGVLQRDFIPCKNASGAVGMWDDVNSKFYANAGTGTFAEGPSVTGTNTTLVNGTAYEVKSGKCLVNGTAYSVKKGRTLIDGVGYDVLMKGGTPKLTWYFNDTIEITQVFDVNFTSGDAQWTEISYNSVFGRYEMVYAYVVNGSTVNTKTAYDGVNQTGWNNTEKYRTIIFDEEPTGDLLTWLQANATPQ